MGQRHMVLAVQAAQRLVDIIDAGHYPANAFENGKAQTLQEFRSGLASALAPGSEDKLISNSEVIEWLGVVNPALQKRFLNEF